MYTLLGDEYTKQDYKWYADVSMSSYDKSKYIVFTMFDPVDWKGYEAYYSDSSQQLTFCPDCHLNEKIKIDVMKAMIDFIYSDEYINFKLIEDGEYHEYIYEIG